MHSKVEQALRAHAVDYNVHRHDAFSAPIHSPADFAAELGYELARITKTLLVRSVTGDVHAMLIAPMGRKIDFRGAAKLLNVKRVEVAPAEDLASLVGYPEKGVSPLGITHLPIFIDEGLFGFPTILVGAGTPGVEIEIAPENLAAITCATRASLGLQ